MKMALVTSIAIIALAGALPAIGGPDWQMIEEARTAKRAEQQAQHDAAVAAGASSGGCRAEHQVLPLDHGPRAQATPHQNQQSAARDAEEMQSCEEARQKEGAK